MAKASTGGNFGELSPGSRVGGGRFLLKRLIGRGEFSEVWLARDVANARDAALKFLPRAFLQDPNLLELIQAETRRGGLLKHPHIVAVHELVRDYDTAAIAMDYVDGWSLATLKVDKSSRSNNVQELESWVREICEALTCAHNEFGMVHGDLKPSNLLASAREGIKISDFGFAVLIRNESSKRGIIKSGYGQIGFLSPQQVMGAPPSRLDDIYSLGASIFDLLTGAPPFYKDEVIAQICSLPPPRIAQRLAELGAPSAPIPPNWEEAVAACLAKNPADRPQTPDEILRLLERKESAWTAGAPPPMEETSGLVEPPATSETAETSVAAIEAQLPVPPLLVSPQTAPGRPPRTALLFGAILAILLIGGLLAAFWFFHSGMAGMIYQPANFIAMAGSAPGSLDKSFNAGTGTDNGFRCLALLPDGKILAGGFFTNYNGAAVQKIIRLNAHGALDTAFAPQPADAVFAVAAQSDGKILIGGEAMTAGRGHRHVLRLNADGSDDEAFDAKSSYNRDVHVIALQPNGGILVGGSFSKVQNKPLAGLVRLNSDGAPDTSFAIGKGAAGTVWAIAVQPDAKIVVAGEFKKFNGHAVGRLVRLNPDGSFDPAFDNWSGADGTILASRVQPDGKILICGSFSQVNGQPFPHIARLNADGSLDAGFHPDGELANNLCSLAMQSDGKIIVGGRNLINNQPRPFLARLNADGSLDASFQVTEPADGSVWNVAVQPDGKILAAGYFTNFDGATCGNIVRLRN